ncbi:MAG: argininosuccinate lyase, partial [Thaumarchaeota archaeon]|nr:argininosuccinate lyase [Nitrososphaerota archaeon]
MRKMLWSGRFSQAPGKLLIEYTSAENVVLDERLIPYDILGSEAHVAMLHKQQILTLKEAKQILKALGSVRNSYDKGEFSLKEDLEDVHMNIETSITEEIGDTGGKMHTARSRNDQVNLDTRLYLRDEINEIIEQLLELEMTFIRLGKRNLQTLMPGYTHTRIAQPITLAFWLSSYAQGFERDAERLQELYDRININPLGACALAGTTWNIDRELTAELLGFNGVQANALDVVSSRGEFEAELLSILSILMLRLSRIAEELILFSSAEFGFFELSDRYATGSSIMPQKKNPDALELMRARCARIYGYLIQVLATVKNLISGHNADTQETKYAAFMGIDHAKASLI